MIRQLNMQISERITKPILVFDILQMPEQVLKMEIEDYLSEKLEKEVIIPKTVWKNALSDTQRDIEINKVSYNHFPSEEYVIRVLIQILEIIYRYHFD